MLETKTAAFTFVKQGIYYFSRRVPSDLRHHYTTARVMFSLRTKSVAVAASRATRAAQKLDEHWYYLRIQEGDLPRKNLLFSAPGQATAPTLASDRSAEDAATLSEAVAIYLRLKRKNWPVTFHRPAERACGYVIDACGDKEITAYTRADANEFRDALIEGAGQEQHHEDHRDRALGDELRRIGNRCFGAEPFSGICYDRKAGVANRQPLPLTLARIL